MASPLLLNTGKVIELKNISAQPQENIVLTNADANRSVTLGTLTLDLKKINNKVLLSGAIDFSFTVVNTDPVNPLAVTELGPLTLTIVSNGTSIYEARIGEAGTVALLALLTGNTYTSNSTLHFEWYDDPVTSSISANTVVYEFILSVPATIPDGETVTISAADDFYSLTAIEIQQ